MRLTRYDVRTAARSAAALVLLLGIAWALTAATDEGGLSWVERAGRVLPLAPACGGVAAWLALLPAKARGELRALASLGRSPSQGALPAVLGAAAVGALCASFVALAPRVDVRAFFPAGPTRSPYAWTGEVFVDTTDGTTIETSGAMTPASAHARASSDAGATPPAGVAPLPQGARAAAAWTLLLAGLAFPLVGARVGVSDGNHGAWQSARAALLALATLAASTVLFAAAAAGRLSPAWVASPSIGLLVVAAFRYRADSWQAAG